MKDFFEIRPITPEDKIPLQVGLSMLSPESIRQRFFSAKKEFSEKELQFLTEVDQVNHLAFVAVYHINGTQLPAGVIRVIKETPESKGAEIGITIVDCYQGRGLGTRLFDTIAQKARDNGIDFFYGDFHTSNQKMHRLLESFGKKHKGLECKHTGDGFIAFQLKL